MYRSLVYIITISDKVNLFYFVTLHEAADDQISFHAINYGSHTYVSRLNLLWFTEHKTENVNIGYEGT